MQREFDLRANERSTLGVESDGSITAALEEAPDGLADPEGGKDGEAESGPMDKGRGALVIEDTEEGPGDSDGTGEITFGGGEGVGGGGGLEEEQGEEDEDLGEDAGVVVERVDTERVEAGKEDQVGRPAVPEREGEVNEQFVRHVLSGMMLLDDEIDVRDGRADEEREDESDDVVAVSPDVDVEGVEEDEER